MKTNVLLETNRAGSILNNKQCKVNGHTYRGSNSTIFVYLYNVHVSHY